MARVGAGLAGMDLVAAVKMDLVAAVKSRSRPNSGNAAMLCRTSFARRCTSTAHHNT